ncbi:DUF4393 domain-containing protein [Salmonella enterica subsp. salamae]|nr:DUF4393 domain-containing protein [Salmonella enterica subsp. salamae]EDW4473647.1 DUF4393 domain-containing protein [Salmonella enterica subsp. salamae]HCM1954816.1 DUF4393 domain-containing protein [Salmonella enterica subsp. salamae serovar 9,46:z4,z24:z39:z42]
MDNGEIVSKVIDSKVVENTYNDALSPGLKELGKVGVDLAKTARLLLAPLQIAATFQERLERFLREMNERIPESQRIDIAPEISGPALESMRYVDESNILWGLFKEVLFKSADQKHVNIVHPSFIQIIKQLTRDEAFLLLKLDVEPFYIVDTMDFIQEENRFTNKVIERSTIPTDEFLSPESMGVYHLHLESLSLIAWPVTKQEPIHEGGVQVGIRRYSEIHLTEFGRLFVTACIPTQVS